MSPGDSPPGRHLIQQRLEQVEIAAIDERHFYIGGPSKGLGRIQPSEASPHNHHAMGPVRRCRGDGLGFGAGQQVGHGPYQRLLVRGEGLV
jgi:hypothetical protein